MSAAMMVDRRDGSRFPCSRRRVAVAILSASYACGFPTAGVIRQAARPVRCLLRLGRKTAAWTLRRICLTDTRLWCTKRPQMSAQKTADVASPSSWATRRCDRPAPVGRNSPFQNLAILRGEVHGNAAQRFFY